LEVSDIYVSRKHFGFRETADEMILQHVTTKEVMKEV
jgi:hypothetical protein